MTPHTFNAMTMLTLCSLTLPAIAAVDEKAEFSYPNKTQRIAIAEHVLSTMERIDALNSEQRNLSRTLKWPAYKEKVILNAARAQNFTELNIALDNIHYGIINLHSFLQVEPAIAKHAEPILTWPSVRIGYTWPKLSFFSLDNNKTITELNGHDIHELFNDYYNQYCRHNHDNGCLSFFSKNLEYGYRFAKPATTLTITYQNGSQQHIEHSQITQSQTSETESKACKSRYPSLDLTLAYQGSQSCLYQTDKSYVLKINEFGPWGAENDDIYCLKPNSAGMCNDINAIKKITQTNFKDYLVIDMQNNGGGSENTPWIAALTHAGFYDNLITYKNILELQDPDTRASAFYSSVQAEKWYQTIIKAQLNTSEYLPIRADFCRGSALCENKQIPSSINPIAYKKMLVVINEHCVSSCDDFVWRMRSYAGATTLGQYPATDGTYARVNATVYITSSGEIKSAVYGEGRSLQFEDATPLVTFRMPLSKTVTPKGKIREGDKTVLDIALPIDKTNFTEINLSNLAHTLQRL